MLYSRRRKNWKINQIKGTNLNQMPSTLSESFGLPVDISIHVQNCQMSFKKVSASQPFLLLFEVPQNLKEMIEKYFELHEK